MQRISQRELKEILKQHKIWLDSDGKEGKQADLGVLDLAGYDLSELDLRRINFAFCSLVGVNFDYSDLSDSTLVYSDLTGACLKGAKYEKSQLEDVLTDETTQF